MRYLGLDVGDRWIGVALSDPSTSIASPLTIIKRTDDEADMQAINYIITENEIGKVIVGLPRMLNGSIGIQAQKVQAFTQKLRQQTGAEIEFRDEWLTTVSARRIMHNTGSKKTGKRDDAVAAAVLLQAFLDENR
jgi:putative Holliday junction resolvase